jgi:hypothetical protein
MKLRKYLSRQILLVPLSLTAVSIIVSCGTYSPFEDIRTMSPEKIKKILANIYH